MPLFRKEGEPKRATQDSAMKENDGEFGFKVVAEGADVVRQWVEYQNSSSDESEFGGGIIVGGSLSSFPRPDSVLELGKMRLNGIFSAIASRATYNHEDSSFEINSSLILKPNLTELGGDIFSPGKRPLGEILEIVTKMEENKPEVSMDDIENSLKREKEFSNKYTVTRYKDERDFLSIALNGETDLDEEEMFTIHHASVGPISAYCVHIIKDATEENVEGFEEKYSQLAEISEYLINAVYKYKKDSAPEKTFKMGPPKNTLGKIEHSKQQSKLRQRALSATGLIDDDGDLEEEMKGKILLEERPNVTFDDIGGNETAKAELQTVVDALKNPEKYEAWGTQAPKGVLLFGPPGTGKTLLTKALAHEAEAQIMVVNTTDVLHALYGRTEKLIQAVFDLAEKNTPVIVLFDELDAIAGNRDRSTEVTGRIVSVILQNLDGLEQRKSGLFVAGTTNRLELIDPALLRPGRLDLLIEVTLPDEKQRKAIFDIHINNAIQRSGGRDIFSNLDIEALMQSTKGFSGADIEEIIRRTLAKKVRQESQGNNPGPVNIEDLKETIEDYEKIRKAKEAFGFARLAQKDN